MPIFSRRGSGPRIFFATDIHGSETCFRKFLNSAKFYEADMIVLGGDMTGKALVPIVSNGDGACQCYLQDQRHDFGADELERYERMVRDRGLYPFRTTAAELAELRQSPERLKALDRQAILDVVAQWVSLADERLAGTKHQRVRLPWQRRHTRDRPDPSQFGAARGGRGPCHRSRRRLSAAVHGLGQSHAVEHRP